MYHRTLFLLLTITATATFLTIGLILFDSDNSVVHHLNRRFFFPVKSNESIFDQILDFEPENEVDDPSFMNIDKTICSTNSSSNLLIICFCAVDHFDHRLAVRDTWGRVARENGIELYFIMGLPINNSIAQSKLYDEELRYGDILQTDFCDTYHNLTLKTLAMMRWISQRKCSVPKFVLKVDDDMLVNVDELHKFTQKVTQQRSFIGKVAQNWLPARNHSSKYYISEKMYNGTVYPDFVTGQAYLFTSDIAKSLYIESRFDVPNIPYLEDVYVSGILAERLNITRVHHKSFVNIKSWATNKNFAKLWTVHGFKPNELRQRWEIVNKIEVPNLKQNSKPKPKPIQKQKPKQTPNVIKSIVKTTTKSTIKLMTKPTTRPTTKPTAKTIIKADQNQLKSDSQIQFSSTDSIWNINK